jgi:hypothetical protein
MSTLLDRHGDRGLVVEVVNSKALSCNLVNIYHGDERYATVRRQQLPFSAAELL